MPTIDHAALWVADLEAAHGTVAGCLRAHGLSEAELSALMASIVAGPHPG